jgi:hypothetical protein
VVVVPSLVVGGSAVGLSGLGSRASSLVTTRGVVAARSAVRAALRVGGVEVG